MYAGLIFLALFLVIGGWAYAARSLIRNDNWHPQPTQLELERAAITRAVLHMGERLEEMRASLARIAESGVKAEEAIRGFQSMFTNDGRRKP